MEIKKDNKVILDTEVDDTSFYRYSIMQENAVHLKFSLMEHVEFPVGCYIDYQNERYTLWRPASFTQHSSRNFLYDIKFESYQEALKARKFKNLSMLSPELKFPLTATAKMVIRLIVDNMNTYDSGWYVGECIESTERVLSFNHEYCYDVLQRMASEFNTEWEIEGKTIHFRKIEKSKDSPLPLSYGKGNGFKSGTTRRNKSDKSPVTMLYVQGGERNIDYSTYQNKYLLLPKSQEYKYEGRTYKTDEYGSLITRSDKEITTFNDDSFDGSSFYPSRVGEVTSVEVTEQGIYCITDTTIPADLDYSNYRLAGSKATLIFQSGVLTGQEFDLVQTEDELTGYIHSERKFKLVSIDEGGVTLPNENRKPSVGDKYAVFNITLPESYICNNAAQSGASWEMFREAVRYMYENEEETFSFTGELDGIWAKKNWPEIAGKISPGSYILFSDNEFQKEGLLIRITSIEQSINNPHSPKIQLSNVSVGGFVSTDLGQIDANEVLNEERYKNAKQHTIRRWRDVMETLQMMFDPEGDYFTELIKPLAVHTAQLIVGTNSQQLELIGIRFIPNANHDPKAFQSTAGQLVHFTVNQDGITKWNIPASSHNLNNAYPYYVYARCSKTADNGTIIVTTDQIKLEAVEGYYHFWIGVLNAPEDGVRSWNPNYGYTEIAGQTITTGIIKDKDSKLVIDLTKGTLTGYGNITDRPDLSVYVYQSELKVQADRISATVQAVNEINGTIKSAGWVTTSDGNKIWARQDDLISMINVCPEKIAIKSDKISLEGHVTANGNVEFTKDGKIIANSGIFKGYLQTPFVEIGNSDATHSPDSEHVNGAYTLKEDLNVMCGPCTVILPNSLSYVGAHVKVFNAVFVYTRAGAWTTTVKVQAGGRIYGTLTADEMRAYTIDAPKELRFASYVFEFIGIPDPEKSGYCSWMVTNYNPDVVYVY